MANDDFFEAMMQQQTNMLNMVGLAHRIKQDRDRAKLETNQDAREEADLAMRRDRLKLETNQDAREEADLAMRKEVHKRTVAWNVLTRLDDEIGAHRMYELSIARTSLNVAMPGIDQEEFILLAKESPGALGDLANMHREKLAGIQAEQDYLVGQSKFDALKAENSLEIMGKYAALGETIAAEGAVIFEKKKIATDKADIAEANVRADSGASAQDAANRAKFVHANIERTSGAAAAEAINKAQEREAQVSLGESDLLEQSQHRRSIEEAVKLGMLEDKQAKGYFDLVTQKDLMKAVGDIEQLDLDSTVRDFDEAKLDTLYKELEVLDEEYGERLYQFDSGFEREKTEVARKALATSIKELKARDTKAEADNLESKSKIARSTITHLNEYKKALLEEQQLIRAGFEEQFQEKFRETMGLPAGIATSTLIEAYALIGKPDLMKPTTVSGMTRDHKRLADVQAEFREMLITQHGMTGAIAQEMAEIMTANLLNSTNGYTGVAATMKHLGLDPGVGKIPIDDRRLYQKTWNDMMGKFADMHKTGQISKESAKQIITDGLAAIYQSFGAPPPNIEEPGFLTRAMDYIVPGPKQIEISKEEFMSRSKEVFGRDSVQMKILSDAAQFGKLPDGDVAQIPGIDPDIDGALSSFETPGGDGTARNQAKNGSGSSSTGADIDDDGWADIAAGEKGGLRSLGEIAGDAVDSVKSAFNYKKSTAKLRSSRPFKMKQKDYEDVAAQTISALNYIDGTVTEAKKKRTARKIALWSGKGPMKKNAIVAILKSEGYSGSDEEIKIVINSIKSHWEN